MKLFYSGHPWDVANWLLFKGGMIIQCTFNREVLFGTLLGGCFRDSYTGLRYGCFKQVSLYLDLAITHMPIGGLTTGQIVVQLYIILYRVQGYVYNNNVLGFEK